MKRIIAPNMPLIYRKTWAIHLEGLIFFSFVQVISEELARMLGLHSLHPLFQKGTTPPFIWNHAAYFFWPEETLSFNVSTFFVPWVVDRSQSYIRPKIVSGFWSLRAPLFLFIDLFVCLTMKRCPIAAKIAGSIGILPCCVVNVFFT